MDWVKFVSTRTTTRITECFDRLKADGQTGFIPYITAGDPDLKSTKDIVLRLEDAGADIIELGVPFTDPLADGPVNMMAADRGLASGTTLQGVFETVADLRKRSDIPLVLYTYMNPMFAPGFEKSAKQAAQAGVDGVLVVDLPDIESAPYSAALRNHKLDNICLVTPTTPEQRIKSIAKVTTGFLYTVSRAGVTGAQKSVQKDALGLLKRVHKHTRLPVALGFGVSTPAQARAYAKITEAVVVGSFVVQTLHEGGKSSKGRSKAVAEIKKLIDAVKSV